MSAEGYLRSGLAFDAVSWAETEAWFNHHRRELGGSARQIPLCSLAEWRLSGEPHRLEHRTGRFFSVEGYRLSLAGLPGLPAGEFDQPLVNQPEVGILGFLTRVFAGVRYFLTQAKMEPGNVELVQLAPTVQATVSNYSRVHGGSSTPYLEYFTEPGRARVLVDEVQPEQGAYFLGKRNRNVVLETDDDVAEHSRFRWLPLAELRRLLRAPYTVNMDARSVLSCLPTADPVEARLVASQGGLAGAGPIGSFGRALARSCDPAAPAVHPSGELNAWWDGLVDRVRVRRAARPLDRLEGWVLDHQVLRPAAGDAPFSVIGVEAAGGSREIPSWTQPMLARPGTGLLGLLAQERGAVLHFAVQASVEAGCARRVQLMPTVVRHEDGADADQPLGEWFGGSGAIHRVATQQSEEGGRFWRFDYRYRVTEAPADARIELPPYHRWMTLAQLNALRARGVLGVEVRNLLACLDPSAG